MDWKTCCSTRIVKAVHPDSELMTSLEKSSKNKLAAQEKLVMDETTAASKISLAYDSLLELLEVLALKNRYKVYKDKDCERKNFIEIEGRHI